MAINTVVQGSAADIIKKAMLEVDKNPVINQADEILILWDNDPMHGDTRGPVHSVSAFPVNGRLQALRAGKPGSATAPDSLSLFHFNTTGERNT